MSDPKKSIESLRRSEYRISVLDWLMEIATTATADMALRSELDRRIWQTLAMKGIEPSSIEIAERKEFCRSGSDFDGYARLVEAKLLTLAD